MASLVSSYSHTGLDNTLLGNFNKWGSAAVGVEVGSGASLTYSFPTSLITNSYGSSYANGEKVSAILTAAQQASFVAALNSWGNVANIKFTKVADTGFGGDIRAAFTTSVGSGFEAYAYTPSVSTSGGDVWLSQSKIADFAGAGLVVGTGYGYETLMHEIGHALGLDHPGGVGDNASYDRSQTIMSYNDSVRHLLYAVKTTTTGYSVSYSNIYQSTPMIEDIKAIQQVYGANKAYKTGNDTYIFSLTKAFYQTIWDAGGNDTISVKNFIKACTIDLREGHMSSIHVNLPALPTGFTSDYTSNFYDGTNNLGIAYGAIIENAIGGAGDDTIIGNDIANTLNGGIGSDSMSGGKGNDIYYVDNIGDSVVENINEGTDIVNSNISYTLSANVENLTLIGTLLIDGTGNSLDNVITGNAVANVLSGGDGNDMLDGKAGVDTMLGGAGNDTYYVNVIGDIVCETTTLTSGTDAGGTDTINSSVSYTLGNYVENLTLIGIGSIKATGNGLDNVLNGNKGANTLDGQAGNDTIIGGLGIDILTGGAGNDIFVFDTAPNSSSNKDTIIDFTSGEDVISLSNTIFTKLGAVGALSSNFFFASSTGLAGDADDYLNYNTTNGKLYYDFDGKGAGIAIQIALIGITSHSALSSADFTVSSALLA